MRRRVLLRDGLAVPARASGARFRASRLEVLSVVAAGMLVRIPWWYPGARMTILSASVVVMP